MSMCVCLGVCLYVSFSLALSHASANYNLCAIQDFTNRYINKLLKKFNLFPSQIKLLKFIFRYIINLQSPMTLYIAFSSLILFFLSH